MILGFTGTRAGLTPAQRAGLVSVLACLPAGALHGGADGADQQFDELLCAAGMCTDDILILPCNAERAGYWHGLGRKTQPLSQPLTRNRVIVQDCDHLVACPATRSEQLRSDTWATVRYARTAGREMTLIFPDGAITEEKR